jgi:hypothetical protein
MILAQLLHSLQSTLEITTQRSRKSCMQICNKANSKNASCDKRISNPKDLSRHIRFEHQHELIPSALNSGVSPLWRGPRTAGSVFHRCNLCEDDFLDLNKNTEQYPHYCISVFHCPVCDLRFSELRTFNRHLKRHDPDREMFPCTEKDCKKEYARKVNLNQHIQNVQKLICPHCGIGFSLCCRSNFKNHVLRHVRPDSEKQKHRCTYEGCINEYRTLTGLKNHIDSKHREVRLRYDIDGCGATFTTTSGWRQHCHVEHEGVEMAELIRSKASQRTIQHYANMRAKAAKGLCSVSASCPNKGVIYGKVLIPACKIHR